MTNAHDHTWQTRSRHWSSEGTVSYQRCHCGRWQVRLGPTCVLATTHDDDHGLRLIAPPAYVTDTIRHLPRCETDGR